MPQPENVAVASMPWFAHQPDGTPITRERSCLCGKRFTQRLLSERFLNMVDRHSRTALDVFQKQVRDGYVPVHCPICERRDLRHQANIDEHRQPPHHTERDHAAD